MGRLGRKALVGVVAAVVLLGAAAAQATTGPTPLAFPPKYKISRRAARPFVGVFKLRGHGRVLVSAGLAQRFNEAGYFQGSLEVYQYFKEKETSWVGTTYEYRVVDGRLHVDVFSPNGQGTPLLARMVLTARGKKLSGVLHVIHPHITQPQKVTFLRVKR